MENDNKSFWQRFAKLYSPIMEKAAPAFTEISATGFVPI